MKLKTILTQKLFLIGVISVVLTSICSFFAFWFIFTQQVEADLSSYSVLVRSIYKNVDSLDEFENILNDDYRVTLIDEDGTVLFESSGVSISSMDNHGSRPEIISAKKYGVSSSSRESQTLGNTTYYYAMLLNDGDVLRVAKDADNFYSIFWGVIIFLVLVVLFVLFVCLFIASETTKGIIEPIELMLTNKDEPPYQEFLPISMKISDQNERIKKQMDTIQGEADKITAILANMAEGLIFLDTNKNIISYNKSSLYLLNCKETALLGQPISKFTNNKKILKSIDLATSGKSKIVDLEIKKKQLQFMVNPVFSGKKQAGIICMIVDVSAIKEVDIIKQEFTANVSHELKTPLTTISGYAEMIESGIAKPDDVKEFSRRIHKESIRLLALISDIIKLSQLEEVAPEPVNFEQVDLKNVALECVENLELYSKKHNVTIKTSLIDSYVFGDRHLLYELIYNLCDNAIRYNKDGGTVMVTLSTKGENKIRLSVKDDGIGIPKEHRGRIFERFYRVDKSRSKQTGGTGLGLAIVKHICEKHNARLELITQVKVGTEIIVTFKKYNKE